jgi:hypothetical protein
MKATLNDGSVLKLPFPGCCIGYHAAKLELERNDIKAMRYYAAADPQMLVQYLDQLEHRLPTVEQTKIDDALVALKKAYPILLAHARSTAGEGSITADLVKHTIYELEK